MAKVEGVSKWQTPMTKDQLKKGVNQSFTDALKDIPKVEWNKQQHLDVDVEEHYGRKR